MIPEMHLPLAIFLIPYGLFLFFYTVYALFNLYHLLRFGVYNAGAYALIIIFCGGTIFLVGGSLLMMLQYDWSATINMTAIFQGSIKNVISPL